MHIAYTFDDQIATKHATAAEARKAANARTGRVAGVGWERHEYRSAGCFVPVWEKAEHAGRELWCVVFRDRPLDRMVVVESHGLDFVEWPD